MPAWPDVLGQRQDPCVELVITQTLEDLILEMFSSRQASPSRVDYLPSICLCWQPLDVKCLQEGDSDPELRRQPHLVEKGQPCLPQIHTGQNLPSPEAWSLMCISNWGVGGGDVGFTGDRIQAYFLQNMQDSTIHSPAFACLLLSVKKNFHQEASGREIRLTWLSHS